MILRHSILLKKAGIRLCVLARYGIALSAALVLIACGIGEKKAEETETEDPSLLTVDRLYNSNEFAAESFGAARWVEGGAGYLKIESAQAPAQGREIVRFDTETGSREITIPAARFIPAGQKDPISFSNYEFSPDRKSLLLTSNTRREFHKTFADYWFLDLEKGTLARLGGNAGPSLLLNATWSPDSRKVAYIRGNNIYIEEPGSGRITQVIKDGSETTLNGTFDYVFEEEFFTTHGFRWSPDGKSIAYIQLDSSRVQVFHMINNTDSIYPRLIPIRFSKPGETSSSCRIGVVSAAGGPTRWFDVPGDPANNYIQQPVWTPDSREVWFQHLNREQNKNELMAADPLTGRLRTVKTESDPAWVELVTDLQWLEDGKRFLWVSESDGWRHAYAVSRDGKEAKLITQGPYDVVSIKALDEAGGWLYFIASPDNPTQRYLYRAALDASGKTERLTPQDQPGTHVYQISPGARWAFHTYSTFATPPLTELVRLADHTKVRVLVDNARQRDKVGSIKRGKSEFFRVDIGDGVEFDVWSLKPHDFNPNKKYPVLFNVYGEPFGSTVTDTWGGNRYLWHVLLTQKGYVLMSVDNRGTRVPRGREWRKSIYRQVGILASADQAAAVRAIEKRFSWVDPGRIGIYGGSGGGAMTLNALFRYPDVYAAGIASSSPTDQRLYNSIYQEKYMNLPANNPEGYKNGSPVNFAHQLKGRLLIIHGTGDDNVHYQNQEVLINALIKANKQFAMMSYPNRSHGISEGENTVRHKNELMLRFLLQNLPPGPR
jgi:dipeptidyl-peptidase-4